MDYKIEWTEPALQSLDEILAYIAQDNSQAAERLRRRIEEKVILLRGQPLLGGNYPVSGPPICRETREGNYRIFYRVSESAARVEILAVWHAARQEPNLPT